MVGQIKQYIIDTVNSQDFLQRIYLVISVSIELYRVLMSSMLILFVPQNCDNNLCTLADNAVWADNTYNAGLIINFITLSSFVLLYIIEITRENKLIKYLEVNPSTPRDSITLENVFNKIPIVYRNKMYRIDYYYKNFTYVCVVIFIANATLSGIVIYPHSLGNQSAMIFITNILFMLTKIYDTFYVANTDKYIFYSAYMRDHVQFNDIDPYFQKRLSIKKISLEMEQLNNESEHEDDCENQDEYKHKHQDEYKHADEYEYECQDKIINTFYENIKENTIDTDDIIIIEEKIIDNGDEIIV